MPGRQRAYLLPRSIRPCLTAQYRSIFESLFAETLTHLGIPFPSLLQYRHRLMGPKRLQFLLLRWKPALLSQRTLLPRLPSPTHFNLPSRVYLPLPQAPCKGRNARLKIEASQLERKIISRLVYPTPSTGEELLVVTPSPSRLRIDPSFTRPSPSSHGMHALCFPFTASSPNLLLDSLASE